MTRSEAILRYAPVQPTPRHLLLEERDGCVLVTFPLMPTWSYICQIVYPFLLGVLKLSLVAFVAHMLWRMGMRKRQIPAELWQVAIAYAVMALAWWVIGAFEWQKYRRWGRVPRVLAADRQGLALSWLGFRRMRQRTWPVDEITAIEFRIVNMNLNPWRTLGRLSLIRRNGRKKVFQLSSKDPQLPRRIAERVAAAVGRSLKVHGP